MVVGLAAMPWPWPHKQPWQHQQEQDRTADPLPAFRSVDPGECLARIGPPQQNEEKAGAPKHKSYHRGGHRAATATGEAGDRVAVYAVGGTGRIHRGRECNRAPPPTPADQHGHGPRSGVFTRLPPRPVLGGLGLAVVADFLQLPNIVGTQFAAQYRHVA